MSASARLFPIFLGLLLVLPSGPAGQGTGSLLTVTKKETKLRTGKRLYAPGVTDLREGDRVTLVRREGAWIQATWKEKTGWIHESDVTDRKDVRLSGEGVRETYTAAETAAARKGFNPEVEREYRRQHPDLTEAFRKVDEIQARKVPEAELVRFLSEGGLLAEEPR